jgi:hypothetical protein
MHLFTCTHKEEHRMQTTMKIKKFPALLLAASLGIGTFLPAALAQVPGAAVPGDPPALPDRISVVDSNPAAPGPALDNSGPARTPSLASNPPLKPILAGPKPPVNNQPSASPATIAGPVTDPQIPPPGDTGMKPNAKDMPLE